jgi:hypothetical protein
MSEPSDDPDAEKNRIDGRKLEILAAVAEQAAKYPGYRLTGPVEGDGEPRCTVRVANLKRIADADRQVVNIAVGGKGQRVQLNFVEGPEMILGRPLEALQSPPDAPGGPLLGGDAIWNDTDSTFWGTAAFAASRIRIRNETEELEFADGGVLSANHILALSDTAAIGSYISSTLYPQGFRLAGKLPVNGSSRPIDAAVARVSYSDGASAAPLELRALGLMSINQGTGVLDIGNISNRMRILKYGARTGVTAGLDGGMVSAPLYGGNFVFQITSPGFACIHDSGAAVVDLDRKLVGIIVGGECESDCDHGTVPRPCGGIPGPRALYIPAWRYNRPLPPSPNRLVLPIEAYA